MILRRHRALLVLALSLAPAWACAGTFDDLLNGATKAVKSAADAASQAISGARAKPAARPASAPDQPQPNAALASQPASAAAAQTITPAVEAPAPATGWVYQVDSEGTAPPPSSWPTTELQDYKVYSEMSNRCSRYQLTGSGLNDLFEQDLIARMRLARDFPQMLGRLAILNAAAPEAPAAEGAPSPAGVRCLAILRKTFPELDRLKFSYHTFKSAQVVSRMGDLKQVLVDGAYDAAGQKELSPSFAPEDLVALAGDAASMPVASAQPAIEPVLAVPSGKSLPGLKPISMALQKTFSIGAYEAVALKSDGGVEVRSFDLLSPFNPYAAKIGAGRMMPGMTDIAGVRAQSTHDVITIGNVSVVRDGSGKWMGWRPAGPPVPILFANQLRALGMTGLDPPAPEHLVNFAGGRAAVWSLFDDGTVLMSSSRGVLPGTFAENWQKAHKFSGVKKVLASPGPSGSYRAMFLKADGTVWANGVNFYQGWLQAEGNDEEKRMSPMADPRLSPVKVETLSHVRDIAIYWPSTTQGKGVALLDDGSVYWFKIALDIGDDTLRHLQVLQVKQFTKARSVAASAGGVGVVDSDGHVWVWGSNPELLSEDRRPMTGLRGGAAPGVNENEPTMVPGLSGVVDIDFSLAFAGALRSDGSVWVWNREAPVKLFDGVRLAP